MGRIPKGVWQHLNLEFRQASPQKYKKLSGEQGERERKTDVLVIWKLLGREERTYFYHTMFWTPLNTEDALDQLNAALIATMWGLHLDTSGRWGDNKRHRSIRSLTCMIFIMITWNIRCSIFCPGQGLRHFTSASEGTQGQPCHLPRLSYKPSLWPWMGTTAGYHVFGLGIKEIGERSH